MGTNNHGLALMFVPWISPVFRKACATLTSPFFGRGGEPHIALWCRIVAQHLLLFSEVACGSSNRYSSESFSRTWPTAVPKAAKAESWRWECKNKSQLKMKAELDCRNNISWLMTSWTLIYILSNRKNIWKSFFSFSCGFGKTWNSINYFTCPHFPNTAARGQASIENHLTLCQRDEG